MATRRLEMNEGTSSKFWEVTVDGASHTVHFGRIGTEGQEKTKTFTSPGAAAQDASALVRAKLGKGYHEVMAPVGRVAGTENASPSVRTTLKPPRGRDAVVLTLSGPRLVIDDAVQDFPSAAEAKRSADALVRARMKEGYTLGDVEISADEPPSVDGERDDADEDEDESVDETPQVTLDANGSLLVELKGEQPPTLSRCYEVMASIRDTAATSVRVSELPRNSPGATWATSIAKTQLPAVRDLVFDSGDALSRQSRNSVGDLRATLDACPSLERLYATGLSDLTAGSHDTLRELYAIGDPLPPGFLFALARWRLPSLTRLYLCLAWENAPGDDLAALEVLTRLDAARLENVRVDALADLPAVLDQLIASGRTRGWKELVLTGAMDEDALVDVCTRHAQTLGGFETFALPLDSEASSAAEEKVRALCPNVVDTETLKSPALSAHVSWTRPITE